MEINKPVILRKLKDQNDQDMKIINMSFDKKSKLFYFAVKRLTDIILSLLAIVALSPVMFIIALLIKFDSPGPAIFKQKRVGKDGKEFDFYKFRSMYQNAESEKERLQKLNKKGDVIFKIPNDPRVTKIGAFIRKTSIDELPQLINILKADMTIVGPRPPLPNEVAKYNEYQMQRLLVKGGLTCYWQVSGRSKLSFEQWVDMDIKYIKEMSLLVDIGIILKTFKAVLECDGAV